MEARARTFLQVAFCLLLVFVPSTAQTGGSPTYLDPSQPIDARVNDLVARMTLEGAGKPLVVVLMNRSALSVNWANDHANAILEAWYSGRRRRNGDR